jgi:Rod binding domain-containing protein
MKVSFALASMPAAAAAPPPFAGPKDGRAGKVGREFEAILLRQMLASAKVCGAKAEAGYASLATEALADAIAEAGGLGLGRALEAQLSAGTGEKNQAVLKVEGTPPFARVGPNK